MALEDVRAEMEMCGKCSICKFIPLEKIKGAQPCLYLPQYLQV